MKERPILFSSPMVRAIQENRKFQTRRIVKFPRGTTAEDWDVTPVFTVSAWPRPDALHIWSEDYDGCILTCPYGVPGDRLWVKETWQAIHVCVDPETGYVDDIIVCDKIPKDDGSEYNDIYDGRIKPYWSVVYAATDPTANDHPDDRGFKWRPSIFMPRWTSRIMLEITGVRVERLNDITEADAIAEGVDPWPWNPDQPLTTGERAGDSPYRSGYALLWDEINDHRATWLSNPWIWVVEFNPCSALNGQWDRLPQDKTVVASTGIVREHQVLAAR